MIRSCQRKIDRLQRYRSDALRQVFRSGSFPRLARIAAKREDPPENAVNNDGYDAPCFFNVDNPSALLYNTNKTDKEEIYT